MSLAPCSRLRANALQCLARRCMSSAATSGSQPSTSTSSAASPRTRKVQSHKTLPPAKMRALISLYHQADTWITPESLEARIDQAFVPAISSEVLALPAVEGIKLDQLKDMAKATKNLPRMAQLGNDATATRRAGSGDDHDHRSKRETKVFEALYGVEVGSFDSISQKVLPGLEVIEEMRASRKPEEKNDLDVGDLL